MAEAKSPHWTSNLKRLWNLQQSGLVVVILILGVILTLKAGVRVDPVTNQEVNRFLNVDTLMQIATETSFYAIMAAGMTLVIVSGGIDLSVGSIYALSGVLAALALNRLGAGADEPTMSKPVIFFVGLGIALGTGLLCGLLNGTAIVSLGVHPFVITLGSMWILRGVAFVTSKAESILVPTAVQDVVQHDLGLGGALHPVPLVVMLVVTILGGVYMSRTVPGRNIYAVGGNASAAVYAGLRLGPILIGIYALSGLTAGLAAFIGEGYYGAASCADATGYELYVIASVVVGGTSLSGGRGGVVGSALGALLIVLIRQSITTLKIDRSYEWIVIGFAIIVAVVLDQVSSRLAARRLARAAA
jgi:ribose/xylose/arabinose/galactoside ABC-type transport system permease subunit